MNFKMPIAWHEECLRNTRIFLNSKEIELSRMREDIDRTRNKLAEYTAQILEAKSRGVTAFDAEKFGKKRGMK